MAASNQRVTYRGYVRVFKFSPRQLKRTWWIYDKYKSMLDNTCETAVEADRKIDEFYTARERLNAEIASVALFGDKSHADAIIAASKAPSK